jgi:hypothetical protein
VLAGVDARVELRHRDLRAAVEPRAQLVERADVVALSWVSAMRVIGVPASAAASRSAPPPRGRVVSTSVKPSSSRTR